MSGAGTQAYIAGVAGAAAGFVYGGPAGAVIGGFGSAAAVYNSSKTERAARQSLSESIANAPPPPPAATTATLAQAASQIKAKPTNALPTKARASGTIGAEGPQGLQVAPQTANLTLLGGTR